MNGQIELIFFVNNMINCLKTWPLQFYIYYEIFIIWLMATFQNSKNKKTVRLYGGASADIVIANNIVAIVVIISCW